MKVKFRIWSLEFKFKVRKSGFCPLPCPYLDTKKDASTLRPYTQAPRSALKTNTFNAPLCRAHISVVVTIAKFPRFRYKTAAQLREIDYVVMKFMNGDCGWLWFDWRENGKGRER